MLRLFEMHPVDLKFRKPSNFNDNYRARNLLNILTLTALSNLPEIYRL